MSLVNLLPASFRGVPFGVRRSNGVFGRRIALHEYPGRDTPWAEDLGRKARALRFTGFLLQNDRIYGGGDIDLQRAAFIAAIEAAGSGLLTHPVLGLMTVVCAEVSISQDESAGTFSEFEITFYEAGQQQFPSLLVSTTDATVAACAAAALAVADDATAAINLASASTPSIEQPLSSAAGAWSAQVASSAQDATALLGLASQLTGSYGRYNAGANVGFTTGTVYSSATSIADLISAAATQRAAVAAASEALATSIIELGAAATATTIATNAQALVTALQACCADPADAVRLLSALQAWTPATSSGSTAVDTAMADLFHRAAAVSLAQVSSIYQPSSQTDAQTVLAEIVAALDAETDVAGDEGADETFQALWALRTAVATDLTRRGASLAPVRTFSFKAPLPDVVIAQMIYRDPSRADQLTLQVNEVHPLFMPLSLQALAY